VLAVSRGGLSGWNDPVVIGGFALSAVLLPIWALIEDRGRAPMLDLSIFRDRMFAAASVATFISGLCRFALMFIFVFYFQGAQGDSPLTAGIKLAPLALGMLVASPIAGRYSDRHGSRALAAIGMLVTAAGIALMTTLQVHSSFALSATTLGIVGVGSGMFMSPNTAAMMGAVPPHRRGIAAGARMVLNNTGSVLSIAFVLGVVTAAIPQTTLFRIFSGLASGLSASKLAPFIHNMHAALWAMVVASVIGALVSLMRPAHTP
jgi:MFS family permease